MHLSREKRKDEKHNLWVNIFFFETKKHPQAPCFFSELFRKKVGSGCFLEGAGHARDAWPSQGWRARSAHQGRAPRRPFWGGSPRWGPLR